MSRGIRVMDDLGRVRCRECGEFKPPSDMKRDGRSDQCQTICKRCKRQRDRRNQPEAYRNRKNRGRNRNHSRNSAGVPINRAMWRAMRRLIANHQEEYDELVIVAADELKDDVPIGTVLVPEHTRLVYGRPLDGP